MSSTFTFLNFVYKFNFKPFAFHDFTVGFCKQICVIPTSYKFQPHFHFCYTQSMLQIRARSIFFFIFNTFCSSYTLPLPQSLSSDSVRSLLHPCGVGNGAASQRRRASEYLGMGGMAQNWYGWLTKSAKESERVRYCDIFFAVGYVYLWPFLGRNFSTWCLGTFMKNHFFRLFLQLRTPTQMFPDFIIISAHKK